MNSTSSPVCRLNGNAAWKGVCRGARRGARGVRIPRAGRPVTPRPRLRDAEHPLLRRRPEAQCSFHTVASACHIVASAFSAASPSTSTHTVAAAAAGARRVRGARRAHRRRLHPRRVAQRLPLIGVAVSPRSASWQHRPRKDAPDRLLCAAPRCIRFAEVRPRLLELVFFRKEQNPPPAHLAFTDRTWVAADASTTCRTRLNDCGATGSSIPSHHIHYPAPIYWLHFCDEGTGAGVGTSSRSSVGLLRTVESGLRGGGGPGLTHALFASHRRPAHERGVAPRARHRLREARRRPHVLDVEADLPVASGFGG